MKDEYLYQSAGPPATSDTPIEWGHFGLLHQSGIMGKYRLVYSVRGHRFSDVALIATPYSNEDIISAGPNGASV